MQIRPAKESDLDAIREIDGTVESSTYLHVEASGESLNGSWRIEQRPARQRIVLPNRLSDEDDFALKQIVRGADEGMAMIVEHDDAPVALLLARPDSAAGILRIVDIRVDSDYRRQGMGTTLVYQTIQAAREGQLRAVEAETLTNNAPAAELLNKCGFDLSGIDTRRRSNHDLVKESATLFWYAALD